MVLRHRGARARRVGELRRQIESPCRIPGKVAEYASLVSLPTPCEACSLRQTFVRRRQLGWTASGPPHFSRNRDTNGLCPQAQQPSLAANQVTRPPDGVGDSHILAFNIAALQCASSCPPIVQRQQSSAARAYCRPQIKSAVCHNPEVDQVSLENLLRIYLVPILRCFSIHFRISFLFDARGRGTPMSSRGTSCRRTTRTSRAGVSITVILVVLAQH